jgi:L-gulonolactone oxidase
MLVDNGGFELLCRAGRRFPAAIPALNRAATRAATRRERVDRSFRVFASPRLVRFTEMEHALPRERAAEAVLAVKAILERHPVSFPLELRFAAADDALLSPAHARDSAYLAVHAYAGMPWEAPFREAEALLAGWEGRPHWGKRTFLTADELAGRHPGWAAWQAARAELDPGGVFTNRWAERVLGPVQRNARPSPR